MKRQPPKLRFSNFIGGKWVQSSGGDLVSRNPATGDPVATAANSTSEDVRAAIDSSRESFDRGSWPRARPHEKAAALGQIARLIRQNLDDLAVLLTMENGKPLADSKGELQNAANIFDYYSSATRHIVGRIPRYGAADTSLVVYEPVGVCALIVPWNSPISLLSWKLGAALAAGCTCVVKPSEYTPGITMEFARLLARVRSLPPGSVNVVTGPGDTVGSELVRSPKVDKVSFTGSTETGKRIMEMAATNLKKLNLECGGKSANIVFDDANIDGALNGAVWSIFRSAGQSCNAGSRLLIQDTIYKSFMKKYLRLVAHIRVGNGLDPRSEIGPLISDRQLKRVTEFIESGKREGARLTAGGHRITEGALKKGFFVKPTVFEDVSPVMRIFQEEIFGPVVCVLPFHDEKEAIELSNSTKYGLAGDLWSRNIIRIMKVAQGIRTGTLWVNRHLNPGPEVPFGGFRQSGIGRETGMEGLFEYLETKHISLEITDSYERVRR
jgi:betaine-aldehyde dehydrogenase